jgi:hypothetical protein
MKQPFEISTTQLTHWPLPSLTIPSLDFVLLPLQDPLGIQGDMQTHHPFLPTT